MELPYDPAISLLGNISGEKHGSTGYMHSNVHCINSYNSQDMEATSISINRWMDKEDVVHKYNGILLSHQKEWNDTICSNMDGSSEYYTKWSKSDKERQVSPGITYMWNLKKKDTNELIYKTKTAHRLREGTYD